MVLLFVWSER